MRAGALLSAACVLLSGPLFGQQTELDAQQSIDICRTLEDQEKRLSCYDAIPGATVTGGHVADQVAAIVTEESSDADTPEVPILRSRMMRDWELDKATHGGLLRIRSYQPVYALPARYTTSTNTFPSSPTPGRTVTEPENLDAVEAKFQISLKTKLLNNLIGDNGDLWFGYTQQSNWQFYNGVESSPFRETSYEPELFSTWRTGVSLGFLHQSNGQNEPRSRSWNRIYANFGFERGDWQLFIRPWLRVEVEADSDDDNPDIKDFLGHGDLRIKWSRNRHDLGLLTRWVVDEGRGALQLDWHYPLVGDLKAYLQVFTGYGETLIDYNHQQTTVGVGISLAQ
jgi:phospholipase A1